MLKRRDALERTRTYAGNLDLTPRSVTFKCLNKVYESSASTFAINDQLKGSK